MEYRTLPGTDMQLPRLVLGTMTFGAQVDREAAGTMVDSCRDAGITMFDTANSYNAGASERILGEIVAPFRADVLIASKVFNPTGDGSNYRGLRRPAIEEALEATLRRLGTDYLDLYYLHAPDRDTPIEETLGAMADAVTAGKVRQVGVSNYAAWQIAEIWCLSERHGWPTVSASQPVYNLLARRVEDEYAAGSARYGLHNVVYNPLAGGLLSGKYTDPRRPQEGGRFASDLGPMYRERYWNDQQFAAVDALREIAGDAGLTLLELAFRWLLAARSSAASCSVSRARTSCPRTSRLPPGRPCRQMWSRPATRSGRRCEGRRRSTTASCAPARRSDSCVHVPTVQPWQEKGGMTMKLMRVGSVGQERPAVLHQGRVLDVSAHVEDFSPAFFSSDGISRLRQVVEERASELPEVDLARERIGAPISRPYKVVCAGLNYADHARESGMDVPSEPVIFFKASNTVVGPNDTVLLPRGGEKTDWEVELGVVIGREARYLQDESAAVDAIAGYCVSNDVSERAFQLERGGQWVKGKSCETFNPLGPWLVTPDEVGDPQSLDLSLRLNGKIVQKGSTTTMVFRAAYLVWYLSQFMVLEPGDLINTGTPPGVGMGMTPQRFLRDGDEMELTITGLGVQRQVCRSAP